MTTIGRRLLIRHYDHVVSESRKTLLIAEAMSCEEEI
jgi:hypothetical protein